jgi:hypothetical protein
MGRSTVVSNINQALPTNGNDEISAQDLRGVLIADISNEFMNLEDDAEIPVYSSLKSYKSGKLVLNQDVIWKALVNVMPTQIPPTLPATSNIYWKVQGSIPLNEATQPEIELETSTEAGKFVSPRRFWQGIARFKALVGTFLEKITFGKGIALGNNTAPANGDLWYNNGYFGRQGGVTASLLTSLNGKVGRVLFVSKDGNDSTAVVGNQAFSFFTIQAALNQAVNDDAIVVFSGTYNESISIVGKFVTIIGIGTVKVRDFYATTTPYWTSEIENIEFLNIVHTYAGFGDILYLIFRRCKFPLVTDVFLSFYIQGIYKFYDCEFVNFLTYNVGEVLTKFLFYNCTIQEVDAQYASCVWNNCTIRKCRVSFSSLYAGATYQFENGTKFIVAESQNMVIVGAPIVKTLNCLSNKPFNPAITNNHNPYIDIDLI